MPKYPEGVEGNGEIPGGDGGEAPLGTPPLEGREWSGERPYKI